MLATKGFSLIEIIVVVSLISLVIGMITFRWAKPYQAAKFRSEVERVVDFDFKGRRYAMTANRSGRLVYQLDDNTIKSTRWNGTEERFLPIQLSSTTWIEEITTVNGSQSSGDVEFRVSAAGATPTYALHFASEIQDQWVVFVGRTGQTIYLNEHRDVEELFRRLRLQGADAY